MGAVRTFKIDEALAVKFVSVINAENEEKAKDAAKNDQPGLEQHFLGRAGSLWVFLHFDPGAPEPRTAALEGEGGDSD
jgi:hypothetical protein